MTVRIALVSDLHLEFSSSHPCSLVGLEENADLLLAAGDISVGAGGVEWCAAAPIPVCYVPGNHEYYRTDIERTRRLMADCAARFPHVHLLDPGVAEFQVRGQAVRVIGATLWTDYKLFGDGGMRDVSMDRARSGLNDHRLIGFDGGRWLPEDAANAFDESVTFITEQLDKPFAGLSVVMTHHGPSGKVVHPNFAGDELSPAFVSGLDHLVERADVWAYGHTHSNIEVRIGGCRLISNQRGYRDENPAWKVRIYDCDLPAG